MSEPRSSISFVFDRCYFAWVIALALFAPACSATKPQPPLAAVKTEAFPAVPTLEMLTEGANLLGQQFKVTEGGPELEVSVVDDRIVLRIGDALYIVESIRAGKDPAGNDIYLPLTPESVKAFKSMITMTKTDTGAQGKITLPVQTIQGVPVTPKITVLDESITPQEIATIVQNISEQASPDGTLISVDIPGSNNKIRTIIKLSQVPKIAPPNQVVTAE